MKIENKKSKIENGKSEMKKNGFSLVEVLISVILVGLAVAALVVANGSFTISLTIVPAIA